jgi:hypothetical protein
MTHPETYVMTREEWLTVNRALASGGLANERVDNTSRMRRREIIAAAQGIMSAAYDRAATATARGAKASDLTERLRRLSSVRSGQDATADAMDAAAKAIDAKDEQIARLRIALRPFADAFRKADDPGVSDLYDDQPFSLHVSLGAWRRASREVPR